MRAFDTQNLEAECERIAQNPFLMNRWANADIRPDEVKSAILSPEAYPIEWDEENWRMFVSGVRRLARRPKMVPA